ncbi:D-3-phosphoglycerate dehydrogenase [Rhizobium sp. BK529]|uniref:NAD(P)-dependent oxidoreductase n=1 Tax=unclassified Rhizobium TaxID=2613769 RepID=UPI0010522DA7|nr:MULTISPECIES: NAD(P)-dependent oxidoreductase [unclassified Rhizobium]MBB3589704.1 D-3-phosphoglycerate dehydrogenase [Rhizobium sp. BK529]TCS04372.1 D-3-phosphoglycerate dehydrogenase [Rhizobium sp. BK418]
MRQEKYRVLVTSNALAKPACERLEQAGISLEFTNAMPDERALLEAVSKRPIHAILLRGNPPITRRIIETATSLKIIAKHGAGVDSVDLQAARDAGVAVTTAGEAGASAVAELALSMVMALGRDLPRLSDRMRNGHWDRGGYQSRELSGRTLGIVGLGLIGGRLATMAHALGMRVIAARPGGAPRTEGLPVTAVAFEELLETADIISLHCPAKPETAGLIGAAAISRMKAGALLINTARGALVDERAVAAALHSGKLAGAAFDTFSEEPINPENPLLKAPNVILTPHIASQTTAAVERTGLQTADNIIAALCGTEVEPAF